jgi:hypothetical protein
MYTYYNKINLEEHMLYASEIAYIYGIMTVNNNPATNLVSTLLDDYVKKNNLTKYQLYYKTQKGFMTKVYPMDIYSEVMCDFAKSLAQKYESFTDKNKIFKVNINNKNYSFKISKNIHGGC